MMAMCAQGAASGGVPSGCNMVGFAHNCRSLYELWCRENSHCKEATPSIAKFVKGFCKGKCLQVSHHWARGSINPLRLTARFDGMLDAE